MKVFVAASYSSRVNYQTGEVMPDYKVWLEENLTTIEKMGHTVFCALRADNYRINSMDPAAAFKLDTEQIKAADVLLAFVEEDISAGVQTEVGYALALNKQVVLAHDPSTKLNWFNQAIVLAGKATEVLVPLTTDLFISQ